MIDLLRLISSFVKNKAIYYKRISLHLALESKAEKVNPR
jgi:hypothetical protein